MSAGPFASHHGGRPLTSVACGEKVSDEELQRLKILKADFHPEWNYALRPRQT